MMGLLHFESDSGKQEESISNLKTKNKHSLRTPTETFFIFTFGLGQSNWADKFWGIWGIFGQTISTHFGTVSPLSINQVPLTPLVNHYYYEKLSLYIQIQNIYL